MRSIARLLSAFGTLADSLLSLSCVVNDATDKLRAQLAYETDPAALAHNGEALDNAGPSTKRGRKATAWTPGHNTTGGAGPATGAPWRRWARQPSAYDCV